MNLEAIGNLILVIGLVASAILFTTVNITYQPEKEKKKDSDVGNKKD